MDCVMNVAGISLRLHSDSKIEEQVVNQLFHQSLPFDKQLLNGKQWHITYIRVCYLALSWLFRPVELAPYKCSNLLTNDFYCDLVPALSSASLSVVCDQIAKSQRNGIQ